MIEGEQYSMCSKISKSFISSSSMVYSLSSAKLINQKLHVNVTTLMRLICRIRGTKVGTYIYIYTHTHARICPPTVSIERQVEDK
jgi:hypothetical protein